MCVYRHTHPHACHAHYGRNLIEGPVEGRQDMAGDEELTLLGLWASPFVIRARIALNLKGLSYGYTEESLYDKSDLLVRSNPVHKKVPVLIHNGKPVCESQNIVSYVDEVFPGSGQSILPSDPYDRAVARFWASYVDDKVCMCWNILPPFQIITLFLFCFKSNFSTVIE